MNDDLLNFSELVANCGGKGGKPGPYPTGGGPPKSVPEGGVDYLGFKLTPHEGIQMGHKTEGGGLRKTLGLGTRRKIKGVSSISPDGNEKIHDTLKKAIEYIHMYHGVETGESNG